MRKPFLKVARLLILSLALAGLVWAQDAAEDAPVNLDGEWRVLLESSNTKKYIRFRIEEKDGRLRGKMKSRETGTQDLDGRREANGKILFWSTFYTREGASIETSFKGVLEGEAIVGDARFFDKPYKFRAEKVSSTDKDSKE
jgi:hypothetical protein